MKLRVVMPYGQYEGDPFTEIPSGYLFSMLTGDTDLRLLKLAVAELQARGEIENSHRTIQNALQQRYEWTQCRVNYHNRLLEKALNAKAAYEKELEDA